ncbi:MAG: M48 family metalloprotease [Gemmatales bacterium]
MPYRTLFRFMLAAYIPFMLLILAASVAFCAWVLWEFRGYQFSIILMIPAFALVIVLFLVAIVAAWRAIRRPQQEEEPHVIALKPMALEPLPQYIAALAKEAELPVPDRYELTIGEVASVYDDDAGKKVLRIDGFALACIPKKSLLAIITHELAHFAGGDTSESRYVARYGDSINHLETWFARQSWLLINPLTWVIRGYHQLLLLALYASSREQEYAADAQAAEVMGKKETALTLALIDTIHRIPWSSMESIGTSMAMHHKQGESVFTELKMRARSMSIVDWEEAFTKAWKQETGVFDTHPCLKDRIKALGVKRKTILTQIGKDASPPLAQEMPIWEGLEKKLTEILVVIYRDRQRLIVELQQMLRNW